MKISRVAAVGLLLAGYLALSFAQSPARDTLPRSPFGAASVAATRIATADTATPAATATPEDTSAAAKSAAKSATKTVVDPAVKPAATPAVKPAATPAAKPAAKPAATPKSAKSESENEKAALVDYEADVMTNRGDNIIRLVGNVHFHHNGAIIECDSAFRYDANRMDFFGRVIVEQDSTYIYGDRVNYDGRTSVADVFAPIVKTMRADVRLYTYNMSFNTKTSIGTFSGGGVVTQTDKLMESNRGEYNANTNTVKFMDSVALRSDSYIIRTDSLSYNLDAEQATFLARTYIWDHDRDFLMAESGDYFARTSTYVFTRDAYAMTPDNELWADTMNYVTPVKQAVMVQNVQILDTANCTLAFGDWGFYDDSLGRSVLTDTPSVRSWGEDSDTSYMRADTIRMMSFEPGESKLIENEDVGMESADELTQTIPQPDTTTHTTIVDSIATATVLRDTVLRDTMLRDTVFNDVVSRDTIIRDTVFRDKIESNIIADMGGHGGDTLPVPSSGVDTKSMGVESMGVERAKVDSMRVDSMSPRVYTLQRELDSLPTDSLQRDSLSTDSLQRDSMQLGGIQRDSLSTDSLSKDSLSTDSMQRDSLTSSHVDSMAHRADSSAVGPKPERERVVRAYHKVRMWAKDYQAVCDSMVSFSVDSTAIMYGLPILWSDNNQLTADQINVYSKDEKMDWVDFTGDPFITQQIATNDTLQYNQANGKRLRAYFKNNEIDYAWMTGNVMNIYYMDEQQEVVAMAVISCAELTILFADREPSRMIWGGAGEGPIYPIEKVPETQDRFLEGFSWQEDKRPKNAREICNRTARPSFRTQAEQFYKPAFVINNAMEQRKIDLKTMELWTDRTETPDVTPQYFLSRDLLF